MTIKRDWNFKPGHWYETKNGELAYIGYVIEMYDYAAGHIEIDGRLISMHWRDEDGKALRAGQGFDLHCEDKDG